MYQFNPRVLLLFGLVLIIGCGQASPPFQPLPPYPAVAPVGNFDENYGNEYFPDAGYDMNAGNAGLPPDAVSPDMEPLLPADAPVSLVEPTQNTDMTPPIPSTSEDDTNKSGLLGKLAGVSEKLKGIKLDGVKSVFNNLSGNNSGKQSRKLVWLDVYDGYGTTEKVVVRGRVFSHRHLNDVAADDSKLTNFLRTSKSFTPRAQEGIWVRAEIDGYIREGVTDKEGMYAIVFESDKPLQTGVRKVRISISGLTVQPIVGEPAEGEVLIHERYSDHVGVISDLDDTIQQSDVKKRLKFFGNIFLKNYMTQAAVPRASQLYRSIHFGPQGDGYEATHYVSSSPLNLYSRIDSFLEFNQFPEGSIDLKNLGFGKTSDSLFDHKKYKAGKLEQIFETYPNRRFVLFGDSGERDPEVYREMTLKYPGRVIGIYIHNVTDAPPNDSRFSGQVLFKDVMEAAEDLAQKGIITEADLMTIAQG